MGAAREQIEKYHAMLARGDADGLQLMFASVNVTVNGEKVDFLESIPMYVKHYRIERIARAWTEAGQSAICEAVIYGSWLVDGVPRRIVQPWCEVGRVDGQGNLAALAIYLDPNLESAFKLAEQDFECGLPDPELVNF